MPESTHASDGAEENAVTPAPEVEIEPEVLETLKPAKLTAEQQQIFTRAVKHAMSRAGRGANAELLKVRESLAAREAELEARKNELRLWKDGSNPNTVHLITF